MPKKDLPKKILLIRDCTFILPDEFEGTIEDAFQEFLEYRAKNIKSAKYVTDSNLFSTFDVILHANRDKQVCGDYNLLELIDGKYENVPRITNTK